MVLDVFSSNEIKVSCPFGECVLRNGSWVFNVPRDPKSLCLFQKDIVFKFKDATGFICLKEVLKQKVVHSILPIVKNSRVKAIATVTLELKAQNKVLHLSLCCKSSLSQYILYPMFQVTKKLNDVLHIPVTLDQIENDLILELKNEKTIGFCSIPMSQAKHMIRFLDTFSLSGMYSVYDLKNQFLGYLEADFKLEPIKLNTVSFFLSHVCGIEKTNLQCFLFVNGTWMESKLSNGCFWLQKLTLSCFLKVQKVKLVHKKQILSEFKIDVFDKIHMVPLNGQYGSLFLDFYQKTEEYFAKINLLIHTDGIITVTLNSKELKGLNTLQLNQIAKIDKLQVNVVCDDFEGVAIISPLFLKSEYPVLPINQKPSDLKIKVCGSIEILEDVDIGVLWLDSEPVVKLQLLSDKIHDLKLGRMKQVPVIDMMLMVNDEKQQLEITTKWYYFSSGKVLVEAYPKEEQTTEISSLRQRALKIQEELEKFV